MVSVPTVAVGTDMSVLLRSLMLVAAVDEIVLDVVFALAGDDDNSEIEDEPSVGINVADIGGWSNAKSFPQVMLIPFIGSPFSLVTEK